MRRKLLALGASVVLASGVIATTLASASSAITVPKTIHLKAVITQLSQLDLGTTGFSQGDELVFHRDLIRDGKTIGHDGGVCTATSVTTEAVLQFQCLVTLVLPRGEIATQGLLEIADPANFTGSSAVTGGTGIYRNVRGEASIVQVSATTGHLTITLIP